MSDLVSLAEVAQRLRMDEKTLRSLCAAGGIGFVRHTPKGRYWFTEAQVEEYVRSRSHPMRRNPVAAEAFLCSHPSNPWPN